MQVLSPRTAQGFSEYFPDNHRVARLPRGRPVLKYLELDRQCFRRQCLDVGVNAGGIAVEGPLEFGRQELYVLFGNTGESVTAPKLVVLERKCAEYFSSFTPGTAAKDVHLPQTVAGRNISLYEIEVRVILSLNVRDGPSVAANRDR